MISIVENLDFGDNHPASPLKISEGCPEIFKAIRLLSGTVKLVASYEDADDVEVIADKNYVRPDQEIRNENSPDLISYIFEETPDLDEFLRILRNMRGRNHSFYKSLCDELSLCIFAMKNERHTEAFLSLYRSLERMSAACPLIYSSRQNDFKTAHTFLSGIYKDEKSPGELGLLKAFLSDYAKENQDFQVATLDVPIPNWGGAFAVELTRQWRDVIEREASYARIDTETGIITCPFPKVASLIVTIRNRSFHNLSGQKNLDLFRLMGPEPLFSVLTPHFLHWTAYVFLDFARWQISSVRL